MGAIDRLSAGDLSVPIPSAGSDEIGAMARTLALFRDSLQGRDRFAAEAETQRKTIAAAIATISEGFVLYDSDDRIVLFNEQFRAIYPGLADIIKQGTTFGEVLEAVVSRSLVDLGGQSPQEWIAERRARREHSGGFAEYRYGGRYIRISERRIQGGGTVAVYSDITELRRHNIELEQARELSEVANRTKSQFLANMSHELRTPLNAIIGYSEILQEDAADGGQEQLVPDLKKIEGAGRHLLGLINDILDLSKVEAGKMEVFIEEIDISSLLEEVGAIIRPLVAKSGNTLELRVPKDIGSMRTDRTKVKQCLLNVLSNASKFTQNGKLTLAIRAYGPGDGPNDDLGYGHRYEHGAARPAVSGLQPGRCFDHQEVRRNRPRPRHHATLLPVARRRHLGCEPGRGRLDLHHRHSRSSGRATAVGGGKRAIRGANAQLP